LLPVILNGMRYFWSSNRTCKWSDSLFLYGRDLEALMSATIKHQHQETGWT
jgi:hypothetical protein